MLSLERCPEFKCPLQGVPLNTLCLSCVDGTGSPVEECLVKGPSEEHVQQVALSNGEAYNTTSKLKPAGTEGTKHRQEGKGSYYSTCTCSVLESKLT